jgi:hypothetical protein
MGLYCDIPQIFTAYIAPYVNQIVAGFIFQCSTHLWNSPLDWPVRFPPALGDGHESMYNTALGP